MSESNKSDRVDRVNMSQDRDIIIEDHNHSEQPSKRNSINQNPSLNVNPHRDSQSHRDSHNTNPNEHPNETARKVDHRPEARMMHFFNQEFLEKKIDFKPK